MTRINIFAIATGIFPRSVHWRQNFRLAWYFGLFQTMMPVTGWIADLTIRDLSAPYDHGVAFGLRLFAAQGVFRAALKKDDTCETVKDPAKGLTMVMLSAATSLHWVLDGSFRENGNGIRLGQRP